ncbi:hypothetical protein DM860_001837 [Cuscuta australis]|uniref:ATP-dependent Clp protease proteolytic subunit n=2 Tax=Cuscuta sect. Cleistogrammica TaxID=1824901 RepID=A0A328EDP9_9ASTE|nr:hypothetical protein DM860_001837 [Cuscuta australis]
MEVAAMASTGFPAATRLRLPSQRPASMNSTPSPSRVSLSSTFLSPFAGGSLVSDFSGHHKIKPDSLHPSVSISRPKRSVVTMVIPFTRGNASTQPPPDLASYFFSNRIVYLGMSLVPSVTELILAEFLYLQHEDLDKPIFLYINSTGTTKGDQKLGYETEAFAIYDAMGFVKPPIFTLCVGNAWGEAALLLAAGEKGNRAALPSSTIMIRQPMGQFQGQATDVNIMRNEMKILKAELVKLYSKHTGKSPEQIEEDISRPKYFNPTAAVEYGIIDKVLYNEKSKEDRGVVQRRHDLSAN